MLNTSCTGCHGGVKMNAGVCFVYRDAALGVSANGKKIIVPGDPENSEVVKRITSTDPRYVMPPAHGEHHREPLKPEQIELIIEWIRQGAEWEEHWAYIPPQKEPVETRRRDWARQPMDHYVLASLEKNNLSPAGEAPKEQWLRRATLDLTGLPPTEEELEAFLADRSPDAYEKTVDRLLAAPRFGERWAAMWMDVARYADTYGTEKDPHRESWPYRDWLISAFNRDMPYTEFVRDQLAGDLADKPTTDQLKATLFQRMTKTNTEGGTDDEQFRVEAVIDRITTTWRTFQGITMECVQCHSHPYEPVPHEDYYKFMGYFNGSEDCDLDDDFPLHTLADDPAVQQQATDAQLELAALRNQRNRRGAAWINRDQNWVLPEIADLKINSGTLQQKDGVVFTGGTQSSHTTYSMALGVPAGTGPITALKFTILPDSDDLAKAPFRGSVLSNIALHKVSPDGTRTPVPLSFVYADGLAGPFPPEFSLHGNGGGFGGYPKLYKKREAVFVLKDPLVLAGGDQIAVDLVSNQPTTGNQATPLRKFQMHVISNPGWQRLLTDPEHVILGKRIGELQQYIAGIKGAKFPVTQDRPPESARETRLFIGGNMLSKGEAVAPGVPEILNPYQAPAGSRAEMAAWLTDSRNSLLSRVFVNRVFAELFGNGIVQTLGDFGTTGLPPTNQPLLDHLAVAFRDDHGWKLKSLLREMVLSSTYRQDHKATPELAASDPKNLLLARGPRTRLTAEMVRDQGLVASGLLANRAGGASVMPPQPDGVWSRGAYNNRQWQTADGPDRYRRALYTYWKRVSPYPSMLTFDAPSRDVCAPQRIVTNTPLQPLVTLNDPAYLEMARHLAGKMEESPGAASRDKIARGYLLATQSRASEQTLDILNKLREDLVSEYTASGPKPLADTPEQAAMINLASVLLNLDTALTKRKAARSRRLQVTKTGVRASFFRSSTTCRIRGRRRSKAETESHQGSGAK
ncbi:MAG: PSD1 and planctomycete cytochrome C domain-containing protein, partial [Chthoniobacterales bacterium]